MNAQERQRSRGRLAELSPFQIGAGDSAKAPCKSSKVWCEVSTDNVSAEEFYGCVDWYNYPGGDEREPEDKVKPVAKH